MVFKPVKARLLEARKVNFVGKDGNDVNYNEATLILEDGVLIKVIVNNEAIDSIINTTNKDGEVTLEIKADYTNKAKIRLVSFK